MPETITIEMFKTGNPDEYKKLIADTIVKAVKDMQPEMEAKDEKILALTEQNESLSQDLGKTNDRLLKLEKKDVIRSENEMVSLAAAIWSGELADSDVPLRLHKKAQSMVSHDRFVKDGIFDREAFTEAVREEITDWEDRTKETVIGGGTPPGAQLDEETVVKAEDDANVDDMLEMAEGEQATQH